MTDNPEISLVSVQGVGQIACWQVVTVPIDKSADTAANMIHSVAINLFEQQGTLHIPFTSCHIWLDVLYGHVNPSATRLSCFETCCAPSARCSAVLTGNFRQH